MKLSLSIIIILLTFSCEMIPDNLSKPGKAIIYGSGDYTSVTDLAGPPIDVYNMNTALQNSGWITTKRIDAQATYQNLVSDINVLLSTAQAYDKIIIYFSGHGVDANFLSTQTEEAIVLNDAGGTNAGGIDLDDLLEPSELATLIDPLLKKQATVICIFDTCFSGGFISNGDYQNTLPQNESSNQWYLGNVGGNAMKQAFDRYFNDKIANGEQGYGTYKENFWVISACGPKEESWDQNGGVFTRPFVKALTGSGDSNGDGAISIYEAYRYAFQDIKLNWNTYYSLSQDIQFLPQISGHNYDLSLVKL